jgi:hypothetical protein
MQLSRLRRGDAARERGQVLVIFAVLLPVFFGLGAIVIDVGNWFVHKRHLQTQVDAAALAPAPQFVGCHHDPTSSNLAIAQRALEYAGDTTRDPATTNLQVQQPNDVHVLLNSDVYWSANPYPPDNTLDVQPPPSGDGLGDPCNERALDVKATDHDAPLLWGLLPLSASPKAKARVEIRQVRAQSGMLPWAVPEIDPRRVVALFVNEDNGQVFDFQLLEPDEDASLPWSEWSTMALQEPVTFDGLNQNTGVIILVSKDDPNPQTTGTLAQICGQAPATIRCHGGATATSGISFIHGYSGGFNGAIDDPQVRDVRLFQVGCPVPPDNSAAYFTLTGGCSATVQAVVDFDVPLGADPTEHPHCARIPGFTWSAGGLDPDRGTWTGSVSLPDTPVGSRGRQTVNLSGTSGPRNATVCGNPSQQPNSFSRPKVAAAFVSNNASGPIQYLKLTATYPDNVPVGDANSIETGDYNYTVTVGLPKPLSVSNYDDPPLLLRMASPSGSQNQAFDCDRGENFDDEITNGCQTTYRLNYDDLDGDSTPTMPDYEWRNILCTGYSTANLPPSTFNPDPIPDCVMTETGDKTGQLRDGVTRRLGPPDCHANNWPTTPGDAATFFGPDGYDFTNDPRYVTLIVTDDTSFTGAGNEPLPIKYFAGFYVTGWDYHATQSPGCPDNQDHPIFGQTGTYNHNLDNGDVWGYFVNIVVFSGSGDPSETLCAFGEPGVCIAILVE